MNDLRARTAARKPDERGMVVVKAVHPEYQKYHVVWRWLQDSLEGGEVYRDADYGSQSYPVRWTTTGEDGTSVHHLNHVDLPRHNLVRHPHEYPQPSLYGGFDGADAPSSGDEFEFRRALTPVPGFVAEAVVAHLSRIFAREVRREAPDGELGDLLRGWWADVDGKATPVDDWVQEVVAPLFAVLGQVDLAFDHPTAPEGATVETRADAEKLGLNACVASVILPEYLTHWTLAQRGGYETAVVMETDCDGDTVFREWTATGWTLYDGKGVLLDSDDHPYGRTPVFRAFDRRKPRCGNCGQSRYEQIAEVQRASYNVESELTLSNSLQASPVLSGPEDFCNGDSIEIGPGRLLPKKRSADGSGYEGWEYVSPPNDPADKLEARLQAYRDAADRAACLTKPAGAKGTNGNTVSQSGVSKMLDQSTGNDLLGQLSRSLERMERRMAEFAACVLNDGPVDPAFLAGVKVVYPQKFDLYTAADFAAVIADVQSLVDGFTGELPVMFGHMLRTQARLALPGLDDDEFAAIDAEIDAMTEKRAKEAEQRAEAAPPAPRPFPPNNQGGPEEFEPNQDDESEAA